MYLPGFRVLEDVSYVLRAIDASFIKGVNLEKTVELKGGGVFSLAHSSTLTETARLDSSTVVTHLD